jgi:GTPase SAR1 family protein
LFFVLHAHHYFATGREEEKHIAAIEEAIANKGKLDHTVMHGVFLGPARSGKSSLIKRLLKKTVSPTSPSTGVADNVIHVSVKKSSSIATSVFESTWLHLTYGGEAIRLMMLAAQNLPPAGSDRVATQFSFDCRPEQEGTLEALVPVDSHPGPVRHVEMPRGYVPPRQTFENALRTDGIVALCQHLDGSWTLYLSDVGGQMEFQELLPLLVSGPSLFFIVFPLHRDLSELFTIEYELPDGQRSQPYQSSLSLKEAILQSLATIAAMGSFTYKGVGRNVQLKPKVLFIGTHKDLLDPVTVLEEIKKKDRYLQQMIISTSHYRDGLIEFASESQLIFTVDNLSESDADFAPIRSRVNMIAQLNEYQMSIPTHWLIFSLVIRNLSGRVVSYDECFSVAQQCGIDNEEELKEALWFLHTKMGVIRYFPYGDLGRIVILDPQLLFDRITDLIVKTFTFEKAGKLLCDEFKTKGIFSFQDFKRVCGIASDPLLTHSRFFELLKHLRIIVPFLDGNKLFIPCVLAHADLVLYPPKQHSAVPTLAMVFDCGYCPKGVTGAVIKYLMTNEMNSEYNWLLQPDQIFRDQVSFLVGPNLITLCLYPTHFEVVYAPSTKTAEAVRGCSIQDICSEVCQSVKLAIQTVSKDLNLTCNCTTTFYCSLCKSHIAELVQHKGIPCHLLCKETNQVCDFPTGYHYWLEPTPQHKPDDTKPSAVAASLTLRSACKISLSLASKWKTLGTFLKINIGLLDNIEYKYSEASDCLRETFRTWLKQVDPPPSWQALADEVEFLDPAIAEKIRTTYCNA